MPSPVDGESLDEFLHRAERAFVLQVLEHHGWCVAKAARDCRRNRTQFYVILRRHGIEPRSRMLAKERNAGRWTTSTVDLTTFVRRRVDRAASHS